MKALIQLVPRAGSEAAFDDRLRHVAGELRRSPHAENLRVNALFRLADDPLGPRTPYRGTLEFTSVGADPAAFESLTAGLASRLADVARLDGSALLLGEEVVFVESERAPIRYQYLMRAKAGFDHAAYLERYREIHYQFGMRTPGILGYAQFHVDFEASRRCATAAGFGVWNFDSVSELHLESLATFLAAASKSPVPGEAMADEKVFVDRDHSLDFCSTVEWHPTTTTAASGAVLKN